MTTLTHKILYAKLGEMNDTPAQPYRVYSPEKHDGLMEETNRYLFSYDDFQHFVTDKVYSVREVSLPAWLSPSEWLENSVLWAYLWAKVGMDMPENWQRALLKMSDNQQKAVAGLLKTKEFKSSFRQSLHAQLVAWLETPAQERQYPSPFSSNQWGALLKYIR